MCIRDRAEQIEDVVISPNKETPTGMISVEWKDSSKEESFYVTDVNQVKEWLESVNYTDYKEKMCIRDSSQTDNAEPVDDSGDGGFGCDRL